jgi:hypothetical protein
MSVAVAAFVAAVNAGIDSVGFFLGGRRGAFGFASFSERDTGSEADAEAGADVAVEED